MSEPDYEARLGGLVRYLTKQKWVYFAGSGWVARGNFEEAISALSDVRTCGFSLFALQEIRMFFKADLKRVCVEASIHQIRQFLNNETNGFPLSFFCQYTGKSVEIAGFNICVKPVYCELHDVAIAFIPEFDSYLVTWSPCL